jgi:GntR family transcriptional regulator, arabinose operon transcriptional repressor
MATATTKTPRIAELAEQLLADIQARMLAPGDRYLTTAQTSKLLGVGNAAANRALQLLERRRIITRQQRRGAYIASLPGEGNGAGLARVHFLVHQKFLRTEGVGNDGVLIGMQEELPGVQVQISFLPPAEEALFVQQLIHDSLKSGRIDGFVLVRTSSEAQRAVAQSGLPAVVNGAAYPGNGTLARVDRDMDAIGELLTDYLLQRGHKKLACFNRQQMLPGDQRTINAILRRLGKSRFSADAIMLRFLPADDDVCVAEMRQLLEPPDPPTGLICRTVRMAEAARQVIENELKLPRDQFDIAVCDYFLRHNERAEFAYSRPVYTAEEIGRHIARLLSSQTKVSRPEPLEVVIPVELWVPDEASSERKEQNPA